MDGRMTAWMWRDYAGGEVNFAGGCDSAFLYLGRGGLHNRTGYAGLRPIRRHKFAYLTNSLLTDYRVKLQTLRRGRPRCVDLRT